MHPRKTTIFLITWTYFLTCPLKGKTSGVFELKIKFFRNDLGLTNNETCCRGSRSDDICSAPCRTFFKVCLAHYQADISTNPHPKCTFANFTTPVVGQNSINFDDDNQKASFAFPVEFRWPGDFALVIEVWHDTSLDNTNQDYPNIMIARLAELETAHSSVNWSHFEHTFNSKELKYAFRFKCRSNYYGSACTNFCRPRTDMFGHYTCSENGTKMCMDGWEGDYCDTNLNFCSRYKPCVNGGVCTNKGQDSYACTCIGNYTGRNCESEIDCRNLICLNKNTCQDIANGFQCQRLQEFSGCTCEKVAISCQANPCMNDGICVEKQDTYLCTCQPGFTGIHCDFEIDMCHSLPCQNGGICLEQLNGYRCVCRTGYSGAECQVSDCHKMSCPKNNDVQSREETESRVSTPELQTTFANGDLTSQDGKMSKEDGDLSTASLLIILCLGVAILLIVVLIYIIILLCHTRSSHKQRLTQQNLQNLAREKKNQYLNNIKKSMDIFNIVPSSTSRSLSMKMHNEDQQGTYKLQAKHLLRDSVTGRGLDEVRRLGKMQSPPDVVEHFLSTFPSSTLPSISNSSSQGEKQGSEHEKSLVLQADAVRPLSQNQPQHPPKSPQVGNQNAHVPLVMVCGNVFPSFKLSRSHAPQQQQQQQLLQHQFHRHSSCHEEFLTTEV